MSLTESPDSGSWGFTRNPGSETLAMEMPCERQHLPPTTDNPIPSRSVCGDSVWGSGPHRAPRPEHLPVGRGPGPTIPGAHRVLVPLSLLRRRDGAELRLCGVWIRLHLHPPSLDPPTCLRSHAGGFLSK